MAILEEFHYMHMYTIKGLHYHSLINITSSKSTCQFDSRVAYEFSMNKVVDPAIIVRWFAAKEREGSIGHLSTSYDDPLNEVS